MSGQPHVLIAGGGLAGLALASLLARRGMRVDVYEQRADPRRGGAQPSRSIHLALSTRGLQALEQLDVGEEVAARSVPMRGRMVHSPNERLYFQPYSKDRDDYLNCISRADLNLVLIEAAERQDGVRIHFHHRCVASDLDEPALELVDADNGERSTATGHLLIGADGAFSTIRSAMTKLPRYDYQQEYVDYGYKELTVPPGRAGQHAMEKEALHIWPRRRLMLIALPDTTGSFTCTLFLPFNGPMSFAELQDARTVRRFFAEHFSDALRLMPSLADDFFRNPTGNLVTIRCKPWSYQDKAVLVGDACHAVLPFYGQGMNAALEDCVVLDDCVARFAPDSSRAWRAYESLRKPNTDVLAELSSRHFIEMRDQTASRVFRFSKFLERLLHRWLPSWFMPLYSMITFTRMPYREAALRARRQKIALALAASLMLLLTIVAMSMIVS